VSAKDGSESKKRDGRRVRREATEEKILAAVGSLLESRGVEALGVNAIAGAAGVDKVLIYRYFGDLDGLMRRYGESADFWPSLDEILGGNREVLRAVTAGEVASRIVVNYGRALRRRPATIALLSWECAHRNELTTILEETREAWSDRLLEEVRRAWPSTPSVVFGLATLLSAAMNYLVLRSRGTKVFGGMDLDSEEGWAAIEATITAALRASA
jgi:AcrR family transcriptional regulator